MDFFSLSRRHLGWLLAGILAAGAGVAADQPAVPKVPGAEDVFGEPLPRLWPAPVYPPEALKAGVEGRVVVGFVVDAEGKVVAPAVVNEQPPDPRLVEAALAAVRQWVFTPALEASHPVPCALLVPINFVVKGRGGHPGVYLPERPEVAPTSRPKIKQSTDPDYPDELLPRKLDGEVDFEFEVNAKGRADDIKIHYASDAGFVAAGLATIRNWQFEPAHQGPRDVPSRMESPMEFSTGAKRAEILEANGVTGLEDAGVDRPPSPLILFGPVYPRERRVAGESGNAEVEFTIDRNGRPVLVTVVTASQPEFGAALMAAVESWRFKPAEQAGEVKAVTLRARHQFAASDSDPEARLAAALQPGGAGIPGAKGLDQRLQPLWRVAPVYPAALWDKKVAGDATVEFIIDHEGRARLPAATAASDDAFGWAAVTALSQWVFDVPRRGGAPVDVRVSIPVHFAPPKE